MRTKHAGLVTHVKAEKEPTGASNRKTMKVVVSSNDSGKEFRMVCRLIQYWSVAGFSTGDTCESSQNECMYVFCSPFGFKRNLV